MLQPRMFSSLAGLIKKAETIVTTRNLHKTESCEMPPTISVSEDSAVMKAASLLLKGKVIALPTDTIYGIAVSAQNNHGVKALYEIKKRDEAKPIAICVGDIHDIPLFGETSHVDVNLLESLLPGPVTIVLKRKSLVNPSLNPNTDLIGIRIPKMAFVRNVARACGVPIALTSANLSSAPSALKVSEFDSLWPYLGGVFDGGVLKGSRAGSTVIDFSEPGCFKIIREGSALEQTLAVVKKFGLVQKD